MRIIVGHDEIKQFVQSLKSLLFLVHTGSDNWYFTFKFDTLGEKSPELRVSFYNFDNEKIKVRWLIRRERRTVTEPLYIQTDLPTVLNLITDEKLKVQLLYHIDLLDV